MFLVSRRKHGGSWFSVVIGAENAAVVRAVCFTRIVSCSHVEHETIRLTVATVALSTIRIS